MSDETTKSDPPPPPTRRTSRPPPSRTSPVPPAEPTPKPTPSASAPSKTASSAQTPSAPPEDGAPGPDAQRPPEDRASGSDAQRAAEDRSAGRLHPSRRARGYAGRRLQGADLLALRRARCAQDRGRRAARGLQGRPASAHGDDPGEDPRGGQGGFPPRGAAARGFPAGVKWGFLSPKEGEEVYLVINGDESEPGTFKDRTIMNIDPHRADRGDLDHLLRDRRPQVLDLRPRRARPLHRHPRRGARGGPGRRATWASVPSASRTAWRSSPTPAPAPTSAVKRRRCSTAWKAGGGEPRLKPPFPAIKGAFDMPTIVNNIETIAAVPDIIEMGGESWNKLSRLSPQDGGTRALRHQRPCEDARHLRGAGWHLDAGPHRRVWRGDAPPGSTAQGRHPRRFVDAGAARPTGRSTRRARTIRCTSGTA